MGSVDFRVDISLRADPLTAIMLAMVTFISTLVAIYSIGYMHDDPGYWRFFTYIPLFVFSMTMLVSVSNFVLLYVFWEAVGVCSYLLIGFWFEKPEAAAAGKKAFLVNRIGDFGFAIGVFIIWTVFGTFNFHDTSGGPHGVLGQYFLQNGYSATVPLTAICLLLFVGACGKSAQFPLHVWLPDAMEGPTPVSALIHAATMVTAGVYLVARCTPLFLASGTAYLVVGVIGGITALLAALIALTQNDLKRILAYSTLSQLGYMFMGLGACTLAGVTAGMFHLFTHAFFKALLFLGAGSVMHAMGNVIDIRRFGGLRKIMPITHWTFLAGCLALSGIAPLAGFWSKDAIIGALHDAAEKRPQEAVIYHTLYFTGLAVALLTAFYTFRAFFLTFYGKEEVPPEAGHHAHESPTSMAAPLMILAVFAIGIGAILPHFATFFTRTPSLAFSEIQATGHAHDFHMSVAVISSLLALAGVALAAVFYLKMPGLRDSLTATMKAAYMYQLSLGKFFLDELYNALIIWPLRIFAHVLAFLDRYLIDALVNLCGWIPRAVGSLLRPLQIGLVQFYALAMVLGLLVLIGSLLRWPVN